MHTNSSLVKITDDSASATELSHSCANASYPGLVLMHFTIGDVSVSAEGIPGVSDFAVTQDYVETTYVFNIGTTLTTKPTSTEQSYQEGVYSGAFAVTAF